MLEVKKLVKEFDKNIAVNNISFNVKKGRIFGLLGETEQENLQYLEQF